jgi:hypothetical protein
MKQEDIAWILWALQDIRQLIDQIEHVLRNPNETDRPIIR